MSVLFRWKLTGGSAVGRKGKLRAQNQGLMCDYLVSKLVGYQVCLAYVYTVAVFSFQALGFDMWRGLGLGLCRLARLVSLLGDYSLEYCRDIVVHIMTTLTSPYS